MTGDLDVGLTPSGEPRVRFVDLVIGSLSRGSSDTSVTVSEAFTSRRPDFTTDSSLRSMICFRGVDGAVVKDVVEACSVE